MAHTHIFQTPDRFYVWEKKRTTFLLKELQLYWVEHRSKQKSKFTVLFLTLMRHDVSATLVYLPYLRSWSLWIPWSQIQLAHPCGSSGRLLVLFLKCTGLNFLSTLGEDNGGTFSLRPWSLWSYQFPSYGFHNLPISAHHNQ